MPLDKDSQTLSPLPDVLSHGLVAVSTFGLLSFFCSTSLFFYLTWRIISWRRKSGVRQPINQFLFLIYNLLLADIQQAVAFLLNINTLKNNAIQVGSPACFAQGWFVSTGDLSSSIFIFAIGAHTFLGVVKEYRLPTKVFYCCVAGLWTFNYVLAMIGPILHGHDFYVRASAWCWINDAYQNERLWLHYFWIFCFMFGTIIIYAFIFLSLRVRSRDQRNQNPYIHGATPLMILYPTIYVICTSPLAIGRIVALAGTHVSLGYFCAAGTMIACNGWLDVLLYASTRAEIVFSEFPPGEETGLETFAFMGKGHKLGTVTTIVANAHAHDKTASRLGAGRRAGESVENLYGLDQIGIKGEVTVSSEIVKSNVVGAPSKERGDSVSTSWDQRSGKSSQG